MFNSREDFQPPTATGGANPRSGLFFRRSPFLVLAAALIALAVLFAPGAQPAQAQDAPGRPIIFRVSAW